MKKYPDNKETSSKVAEPAAVAYTLPEREARQQATVNAIMLMFSTLDEEGKKQVVEQVAATEPPTKVEFNRHLEAWEKETGILSNPYQIVTNKHFAAIVKMGKIAVPYILHSISRRPSLLFHSLDLIYQEEPTKPKTDNALAGINVKRSCEAWIERLNK